MCDTEQSVCVCMPQAYGPLHRSMPQEWSMLHPRTTVVSDRVVMIICQFLIVHKIHDTVELYNPPILQKGRFYSIITVSNFLISTFQIYLYTVPPVKQEYIKNCTRKAVSIVQKFSFEYFVLILWINCEYKLYTCGHRVCVCLVDPAIQMSTILQSW